MKYVNAAEILPKQLLKELQTYIDGSVLYVPKVSTNIETIMLIQKKNS